MLDWLRPQSPGIWFFSAAIALSSGCSDADRPSPLEIASARDPGDRVPPTTDAYESVQCWFAAPKTHTVRCGYVSVPETRDVPSSATLKIAVAVVYSNQPNPAPEPVVYLEGGPGGAAISAIFGQNFIFEPLLSDRDLIVFDQRGTGYSQPALGCEEVDSLPADAAEDVVLDAVGACRTRHDQAGVQLASYNSRENAADIEALREALGYDAWHLYGISYGSRLALTALRDAPAHIRSVVLDGVFPLQANLFADVPATAQRAFELVFSACAAQADCNESFGDLETRFYQTLTALNQTPAELTVSGHSVQMSGTTALNTLRLLLYSSAALPLLPLIIDRMAEGDYSFFQNVLSGLGGPSLLSYGMYLSVMCQDELAHTSREEVVATANQSSPIFAETFADTTIFDICERWQVPASAVAENSPVRSDVPSLVLSGEFDPVTPPAYGTMAASYLSAAQEFVLNGEAHGSSVSECGSRLVRAFLNAPTEPVDTACLQALSAPSFETLSRTPGRAAARTAGTRPQFVTEGEVPKSLIEELVRLAERRF